MKPYLLVESEAVKLPRLALLALCALYVVPGLVGRDPWTSDDAVSFGVALTMATGQWRDWLLPNVLGTEYAIEGPLPFWLAAITARILRGLPEHMAIMVAAMVWLTGLFASVWHAGFMLARRPESQPPDVFGVSPSRTDFGRAVADAALLILLASFGLIARAHETTAEALQVCLIGVGLFGTALALRRPVMGGALAGVAIGAGAITRGLGLPPMLLIAMLSLPLWVRQYRFVARTFLPTLLICALLVALPWPLLLASTDDASRAYLAQWLNWNDHLVFGGDHAEALLYRAKSIPWFYWPAWPMLVWSLWSWRTQLREPVIAVPLATLIATAVAAMLTTEAEEAQLLPLLPPMAMLAAIGLPSLKRAVLSLIDWFSVVLFSLLGLAIWLYWIAFVVGAPPKMAASAARFAPGFVAQWVPLDLVLATVASVAWILVVRWRVSRSPRALWRAVVLASAGLVLTWFLLMTIWLPVFNYRKTYRDLALQVAATIPPDSGCIDSYGLQLPQRASFGYFAKLRFARDYAEAQTCRWALIEDHAESRLSAMPAQQGWRLVWEGRRPPDRNERFRLFKR
jgi:4-amino-4-deoxy-L-arabinose transferase-like glycosyltransferase